MNNTFEGIWSGFSASIPGSGHIRHGLPCQDASAVIRSPRPALIVCDGRGSASRSQDGANGAVSAFTAQCAVFEPMLASILDADDAAPERWQMFCRILYRTLRQVQVDLSAKHGIPEKEFDFTVAAAIVGTNWIGCFQVGDGSIVLRQDGTPVTAFPPDKGEFANQTHFLRENGEAAGRFHGELFNAHANSGIAITSDGPEYLMFQLKDMTPGPVFSRLFDDLGNGNLSKQDIMDYLTRREWDNDPRGRDDRSIAILAPAYSEAAVEDKANQTVAFRQNTKPESDTGPQPQAAMKDDSVDTEPAPKLPEMQGNMVSPEKNEDGVLLKVSCAILVLALLGGFAYHAKTVEKQEQTIFDLSKSYESIKIETERLRQENDSIKDSYSKLEQLCHEQAESLKKQAAQSMSKATLSGAIQEEQDYAVDQNVFTHTTETNQSELNPGFPIQDNHFLQNDRGNDCDTYYSEDMRL